MKLAWKPARRKACFTALRNNTMLSAAVSASVTSNTASTWLGPNSISSECSGRPSAWAVRCTMRSGSSVRSKQASLSIW